MKAASRLGLTAVVALATLLAPAFCLAQEKKPAIVLSVASMDKIMADIGYLTRAAGTPEFGGLVTLMAGPYLQGLDTKRPSGAYVEFAGPQPTGVAFVPVANLDAVLQQLENNNVEVDDAGGGLLKVSGPRPIFIKEKGGWAFISDNDANLANLPGDPSTQTTGLSEKYNLAVQLNVRSIPEQLVDVAISEMKNGFERNLENELDEEKRAAQEKIGRAQLENVTRLIRESDQITVGWGVDSQKGKTYLDFAMTAAENTKLAKQMEAYKNVTSSLAGLELPGAAATLRFTTPINAEEMAQARDGVKEIRKQAEISIDNDANLPNAEAREAAKKVVKAMFDVLVATMESGKLDGGASLLLDDQTVHFVAGGLVADGTVVQDQLKKLVEMAKESGNDVPQLTTSKHQGVDLHAFSVPVPDDEDRARKVFGNELNIVIGTGKQSVWVAFGKNASTLIKQAIDGSTGNGAQAALPMQLDISVAPIMQFVAALDDNPMVGMLAEAAKKSAGKDHVRIMQRSIEHGTIVRLEIEEGVLQMVGAAAKAQNQRN